MPNERMPLPEFARRLGVTCERARDRIKASEFDFAQAVKPKVKHGRWSYEILRNGAEAYFAYAPPAPVIDYALLAKELARELARELLSLQNETI